MGNRGDWKGTTSYVMHIGGNIKEFLKIKVVSYSSDDVEYRVMAATTYEMVWLQPFL